MTVRRKSSHQAVADGIQEPEALGARPQDHGDRRVRSGGPAVAAANERSREREELLAAKHDRHDVARRDGLQNGRPPVGGNVEATMRPPAANAISLPVSPLNWVASASSRKKPTVSRPSTAGQLAVEQQGNADDLQQAATVGDKRGEFIERVDPGR